jgi:hypothetical protein
MALPWGCVLERRVERIAEPGMAEEGVTGRNFSRD